MMAYLRVYDNFLEDCDFFHFLGDLVVENLKEFLATERSNRRIGGCSRKVNFCRLEHKIPFSIITWVVDPAIHFPGKL
jgi:hypothetical protein